MQEGFGRSRGGFPPAWQAIATQLPRRTKIHLRVNSAGLPMRTEITGGETADVKGFDLVMSPDLDEPKFFLADKGYDADNVREKLKDRRAIPIIPMRRNRKNWRGVDRDFYRFRNLVERCFSKLKHSRRIATRYDKTALSFLGFVDIASIRVWLRFLST